MLAGYKACRRCGVSFFVSETPETSSKCTVFIGVRAFLVDTLYTVGGVDFSNAFSSAYTILFFTAANRFPRRVFWADSDDFFLQILFFFQFFDASPECIRHLSVFYRRNILVENSLQP